MKLDFASDLLEKYKLTAENAASMFKMFGESIDHYVSFAEEVKMTPTLDGMKDLCLRMEQIFNSFKK